MITNIVIPFPVWDFFATKNAEIAKLLNKMFFINSVPSGIPRNIRFKKIKPSDSESDRIKLKAWYPKIGYITAVIGGHESSFGTWWKLVSYKASWVGHSGSQELTEYELSVQDPEHVYLLERVAHDDSEHMGELRKVLILKRKRL